jgi:hypothetical protein
MGRYPCMLRVFVLVVALALPLWEVHCAWAVPSPEASEAEAGGHGRGSSSDDCDHSAAPGTDACCVACVQFSAARVPSSISVLRTDSNLPVPAVLPSGPGPIADDFRVVGYAPLPASKPPPGPSRYPYSPRSPPRSL